MRSSPQIWPGEKLQILALTIGDATRFIIGAGFIEAETIFAHLAHVRKIFLTHGLPNDFYTDVLSLFGHEPRKAGDTDTLSQLQRALGCLGVSHLVAKDPQSKGKIERQFGFWHHANHLSRTTGLKPLQAVEKSIAEYQL